jgi:hypothetical protein
LYEGARSRASCVHSTNSTSHTSFGSTQTTSDLRTRGIFGGTRNGEAGRSSGRSFASTRSTSFSVKPVPQLPT